ncbi:unknown [Bacteroides sp. CAG:927]|nr:unknown [Bacteroides sp. CAG:927]
MVNIYETSDKKCGIHKRKIYYRNHGKQLTQQKSDNTGCSEMPAPEKQEWNQPQHAACKSTFKEPQTLHHAVSDGVKRQILPSENNGYNNEYDRPTHCREEQLPGFPYDVFHHFWLNRHCKEEARNHHKERHVKGVDMAIYHPVGIVARKQILLCMPPQHEKYGHELKNIH